MERNKKSKRNELVILGVTVVSVLLFAFATKVAAQPKPETYNIGNLIAISGSASFYWVEWAGEGRPGTWMEKFVNTKMGGIRGVPIKIIPYDDKSTPEAAVLGFKKLLDEDKVVAINGPSLVAQGNALIPLVRERGKPVTVSFSGGFEAPGDIPIFKSCGTDADPFTVLFKWFAQKKWTKVGMLCDTTATGETALRSIKEYAPKNKIELVGVERFERTDVDLTAQFKRIEAKNPDAIIHWTTGGQAALGAKTVQSLGIKAPLILSWGNFSEQIIKLMKDVTADNVYIVGVKACMWKSIPEDDPGRKIMEWVNKTGTAMTGKSLPPFVGHPVSSIFDAYVVIFSALEAVGPDAKAMQNWIENNGKNWVGAVGGIQYGPGKHSTDTDTSTECTAIGRVNGPKGIVELVPDGYIKPSPRYNQFAPFLKKMMEAKM